MSSYLVKLMPQAQKDLDSFSGKLLSRFEEIILGLYDEPRPHNSKKLSGGSRWRIKVSDYRILYEIDDNSRLVKVYRIAHRKEVYR
ncbi:MAG: type II toxin-antitoxin system RelE/ParE family toxin [Thermodesulfovibrionales bacterium]|nr:type II toxin-antitoxin system RelE/ParE family toxin [Thermodesulfovibrionales bacterium]